MTLPSNTGSTETWSIVGDWLRVCSESHSCRAKFNGDCEWYPTRLVERVSNGMFRVIRSDSRLLQPGRGYITLSHRWGDNNFVKLTKENLSEFEKGYPIDRLRKTFQDALTVATRMGIPYVWIDSLCIIQSGDNREDWAKELGSMAEIYSNSFCNISADWGDETNGLFFERTPVFEPPCAVQLGWKFPSNSNESPRLPPDGDPAYIVRCENWLNDITKSPLNRRGWVLQERLLAPRVIHFSPDQVSWVCGESFVWEKVSWRHGSQAPHDDHVDWIGYDEAGMCMESVNLNHPRVPASWNSVVGEYTKCDLTQQSDRLVALAGIAKRRALVKGQYVAGLWARSLPGVLLWKARRTKQIQNRPEDYGYYAPTFSWAAVDGEVNVPCEPDEVYLPEVEQQFIASAAFIKHRDRSLDPAATITMRSELDGEVLTDDIFGPLTSPEVEVWMRGILRPCRRVPPRLIPPEWSKYLGNICARPSMGVDDPAIRDCFEGDTTFLIYYDRAGDEDVQSDSIVYYYTIIQAFSEPTSPPDLSTHYHAEGLFLKSVDASMGRFERLGLVKYHLLKHHGNQEVDICQPLGNERDLPAWSYNETTGEHTFYIV